MARGGSRPGAGRPKGQGIFGEETKTVRVPVSMVDKVKDYAANGGYNVPLFASCVSAGCPVDATDDIERNVDFNEMLANDPENIFCVTVSGDSMIEAGIFNEDILVVDKSLQPANNKIVVACVDNEFTVKRYISENDEIYLKAENPDYNDIHFKEGNEMRIMGVVVNTVRSI